MRATGDDHADVDHLQIEEQAEVVEITVVERILVVPFDLDCHPALEAVHTVGRRIALRAVNDDCRRKLFLDPAIVFERAFQSFDYRRARTASFQNLATMKPETAQR